MSRYLRVSTFGANSINAEGLVGQPAVDRMLEYWEHNLQNVLCEQPDLIVLPEACDRFGDIGDPDKRRDYYLARGNQVRDFFADIAKKNKCYIAYSAARQLDDGTWRNSTQFIGRKGQVEGIYDKNFPTVPEMDEYCIEPGMDAEIIQCDFGTVGGVICFDLNFEEIRRKYAAAKPDILVFSSMYHGALMQPYWAYSCRSYFVGAVCGQPSGIIAPNGRQIVVTANHFDHVTADINLDCRMIHLDCNWGGIASLKKKYGDKFRVDDTGYLGAVLILSEAEDVSIDEMIEEAGIELLDDYFDRSIAYRLERGCCQLSE